MLQIFKYNLKQLLHNRSELFWVILFPIILGTVPVEKRKSGRYHSGR